MGLVTKEEKLNLTEERLDHSVPLTSGFSHLQRPSSKVQLNLIANWKCKNVPQCETHEKMYHRIGKKKTHWNKNVEGNQRVLCSWMNVKVREGGGGDFLAFCGEDHGGEGVRAAAWRRWYSCGNCSLQWPHIRPNEMWDREGAVQRSHSVLTISTDQGKVEELRGKTRLGKRKGKAFFYFPLLFPTTISHYSN